MFKRICIVISVAFLIVFVPYFVGIELSKIIDFEPILNNKNPNISEIWIMGVLLTFGIYAIGRIIVLIFEIIWDYIVNG